MTEIKRFTMEYSYHDEEYVYRDNGKILTPSQVLHLLDDLNDKNKFLSDFRGFIKMEHQKLKEENEELKIDIGILKDNHEIDREIIDDLHEYVKKLEKENKELKDKNSQLQETLAFRSNQLASMERLVDDLGSAEMARQMEEILE